MLINSYWNIDSILQGVSQKECKLETELDFLSELYPSQVGSQFKRNEMTKLPLSLSFTFTQNNLVSIQVPPSLCNDYYHILKADPTVPNFQKNRYFYDEYLILKNKIGLDEEKMKNWDECIINTNYKRYLHYYNNSFMVQNINTNLDRKTSKNEQLFFNKMVHINNNNKYYQ